MAFSEQPYPSVSMQDIARRAGVTRGLVHHYFGGKRELFREVVTALAERAPSLVRTDGEVPMPQRVEANVAAWLEFILQHRELALMVSAGGMYPHDPELQQLVSDARDRVVDRVILNHTGSAEAPPEVQFLVRSYLGLADSAAREWLYYGRATREQVHTMLVRSLLALMRETLPALLDERSTV